MRTREEIIGDLNAEFLLDHGDEEHQFKVSVIEILLDMRDLMIGEEDFTVFKMDLSERIGDKLKDA